MKIHIALAAALILPACTTLSPKMQLAEAINQQVNRSMTYQSDQEQYGVSDRWVVDPISGKGDCEDYAFTKMFALAEANIASHVQICAMDTGVWHAVTVVNEDGQWVLDNTRPFAVKKSDFACKMWFVADFSKKPLYLGK